MNVVLESFLLFSTLFDSIFCCHSFGNQQYYPRSRARGVTSMDRNAIDLDHYNSFSCSSHLPYSSNELREISTIYPLSDNPQLTLSDGGKVTCSFDDSMEYCSWHNVQENIIKFWYANFEQKLDLDRFDCTSIRKFQLDGNFLLAGGEPSISPQKVSIETEIPCQYGDGVVNFDFWANSENPIVRFCIIKSVGNDINCEDILPMPNPINFSIPTTPDPIRVRIEVIHIESGDIVLIDNIYYTGQICQIVDDDDITSAPRTTIEPTQFLSPTVSTKPSLITGTPDLNIQTFFEEEAESSQPSIFGIKNSVISTTSPAVMELEDFPTDISTPFQFNELSICEAISCNFNDADSCFYSLNGLGGTTPWLLSDKLVGNRHTGIQRINTKDQEKVGFVYIGSDVLPMDQDILVMESPKISVPQDVIIVFDIYLRSIHPRLKVCINNFEDCPYSSPKLDSTQYWNFSQKVPLKKGSGKIFFVCENIRKHQFVAIDNIRLENQDGSLYCDS